jgi:tetratricopeptide (TPR) repeat protein
MCFYARPSARAYGGALACAAAALLSKETGVVVPVLALAHDWLLARRVRWARVGGLAALIGLYLAVRRAALGATLNAPHVSLAAALRAMDYALGYVDLVLAPIQLGLYLSPPGRVVGVAAGVVAATLVTASVVWARRDRVVAFALAWFAVAIAPALALVFNAGGTYAQRFLYLPSVAVAVLVARAAALGLAHAPRTVAATAGIVVALLGVATMVGGRQWRDDSVVIAQAIRNTPQFPGVHWLMAQHHERAGDRDAAARMYLEAAQLAVPRERAFVYGSLGRMYLAAGDLDKSLAYHSMELAIDGKSASALIAIGNIHAQRRDFTQAAQSFEAAWAADQRRWEALYNLALALAFLGRDEEARRHFRTVASGAPSPRYAAVVADARRRVDR